MFSNKLYTKKFSAAISAATPFFQPKLTINIPNDEYEQEADAMADKVMRMKEPAANETFFAPAIFSPSFGGGQGEAVQRKCDACEEEEKVQRKSSAPDIQKQDEDEQQGAAFKPFPPGVTGRWPGWGFNLDVTNLQFDIGNPASRQLSLGLNYPGEPYAALTAGKFAFKLGYDFAENNLFAGGRYGGLSYGLMAGFDNPSFGLGLGYGHFPLFNYNMRSAFQFGNTPLPYDFMYRNELDRTQAAIGNWQQGGATDPDRFFTVVGEAGNFASMTGDMFDVGNKPKYDWGAGINIGYDPQLQWYFMAGVQVYLGKQDQNKKTLVDRKCASCEQEDVLHRKKSSSGEINDSNNFENYVNNLNSSGAPLSSSSKQFFESRFGNDFSNVRIHNDAVAAKSAASINALAYTSGNNIVFNEGQYAPGTESGDKLLAHELTHVVQQGSLNNAEFIRTQLIMRKGDSTTCGGKWACASGNACAVPDVANAGPSNIFYLTIHIDVEADSAEDIDTDTVGHTYVEFYENSGTKYTYGFYPAKGGTSDPILKPSVPGCVVHPDTAHASCVDYDKTFSLSEDQYLAALGFVQNFCKSPSNYHLLTNNCTTFAVLVADKAGQKLPSPRGSVSYMHFNADNPNTLLEGVKAQDVAEAIKSLEILQDEDGDVDLNNGDPFNPTFELKGGKTANLDIRWALRDDNDNSYKMWSEYGNPFTFGKYPTAYIPSKTRALLKEKGLSDITVRCRVRLPGGSTKLFTRDINLVY